MLEPLVFGNHLIPNTFLTTCNKKIMAVAENFKDLCSVYYKEGSKLPYIFNQKNVFSREHLEKYDDHNYLSILEHGALSDACEKLQSMEQQEIIHDLPSILSTIDNRIMQLFVHKYIKFNSSIKIYRERILSSSEDRILESIRLPLEIYIRVMEKYLLDRIDEIRENQENLEEIFETYGMLPVNVRPTKNFDVSVASNHLRGLEATHWHFNCFHGR